MKELISIQSDELCRILTVPATTLNPFELAIRRALEDANSPAELQSIRQQACLMEEMSHIKVPDSGQIKSL